MKFAARPGGRPGENAMTSFATLRFVAATTAALACGQACASFHFIKIVEVFPGTVADPTAQYVVLQAYSGGQNFVNGVALKFYDHAGNSVGTATFGASVANGTDQAKILVSTASAAALFDITADLTMTPSVIASGGRVCWTHVSLALVVDCVAWGDDPGTPGTTVATDVGTPFEHVRGLTLGDAMKRRLDLSGSPTALEAGDDTNNCVNNFVTGAPAPRNNANQSGTLPASVCGDHVIQGLEQCDDGGTTPLDGCDAVCRIEPDYVFKNGFESQ